MNFVPIAFFASIIAVVAFHQSVKTKIQQKSEFNGAGWGIINGLFGVGFILVIFAHNSINKEIEKIDDKKYREYVIKEMGNFTRVYVVCLLVVYGLLYSAATV